MNDDFIRPFAADSCLLWGRFMLHFQGNPTVLFI
jgi:hypothetical protein